MSEEAKKENEKKVEEVKANASEAAAKPAEAPKTKRQAPVNKKEGGANASGNRRGGAGGRGGRGGRSRGSQAEVQSEYTEKVVQIRRVTKVVKGGKKLSFRAVVVIGNEKGKVGVGVGKAAEVLTAIKKAVTDGRKHVVDVPMVGTTVSHNVCEKSGGAKVLLKPAAEGTGIIAGGTARIVLELAGVGDILSKSQGSKSPLNVARATIKALKSLRSFKEVASMRGLTVKQMLFG